MHMLLVPLIISFAMLCETFLLVGAAVVLGLWRFGMSLESCVDHILAIEGSRLQKELANM